MRFNKKMISIAIIAVAILCVTIIDVWYQKGQSSQEVIYEQETDDRGLSLWYTDESLTEFLKNAAAAYELNHQVHVNIMLTSGVEYLENINNATVHEEDGPDVYIVSNDMLEKSVLTGLASGVKDDNKNVTTDHYPLAALEAVTYQNVLSAYPLYYDTSFLVYNRSYLYDYAKQFLEDNLAEGTEITENMINEQVLTLIPADIEKLLNLADTFEAPAQVENIFKWDVTDVIFDFPFAGNYLELGGNTGDDPSVFDINNQQVIDSLSIYQQMNQFFAMDPKLIDYDSVVNEFIQGKTVFILATTDIVKKLEEAKQNGIFEFEYGVGHIPDTSETYDSKSMSITNGLVVNGYSDNLEEAHKLAAYISYDYALQLYSQTGKLTARSDVQNDISQVAIINEEYANSKPIPKLMNTSNYWVQLEIMFYNIWAGNDIQSEVNRLSEIMESQLKETITKE